MNKRYEYQTAMAIIRWFLGWALGADDSYQSTREKRLAVLMDKLAEIGKAISEPTP